MKRMSFCEVCELMRHRESELSDTTVESIYKKTFVLSTPLLFLTLLIQSWVSNLVESSRRSTGLRSTGKCIITGLDHYTYTDLRSFQPFFFINNSYRYTDRFLHCCYLLLLMLMVSHLFWKVVLKSLFN